VRRRADVQSPPRGEDPDRNDPAYKGVGDGSTWLLKKTSRPRFGIANSESKCQTPYGGDRLGAAAGRRIDSADAVLERAGI
jgi:hypothetical protein